MSSGPEEKLPKDFGKYRLIRRIAVGGMAEIFLAHERARPSEQLVIKRILPHLAENQEFVSMFLDEARIAAQLSHPNIVHIKDLGQIEGAYYISMEFVHGEDIRRIYNRAYKLQRSLPLSHSIRVVAEAASGLDHAHKLTDLSGKPIGLVHRDVSPQNILVTYSGAVKVVDFGIAKAAGKVSQTRAGVLKGKYSYMSPEQALGERIDHRTDIFALGVILYETTTGTRLFKRHNELATLQAVIRCEIVPPSEVLQGYPADLEEILLKALARDPRDRFQESQIFSDELFVFLKSSGLYVEAEQVAAFMADLFAGDSGQIEALSGENSREELLDVTSDPEESAAVSREKSRIPPATTVATHEALADPLQEGLVDGPPSFVDETASQNRAPPGFVDTISGGSVSKTTPDADVERRDYGRPSADQQPTVFAQPVYPPAPQILPIPPSEARATPRPVQHEATAFVRRERKRRGVPEAPSSKRAELLARLRFPRRLRYAAVLAAAAVSTTVTAMVLLSPKPGAGVAAPSSLAEVLILTEPRAAVRTERGELGRADERGVAGPFALEPGSWELSVSEPERGFERSRALQVIAGRNYEVEIRARQGWLQVAAAPWARVTLNGRDLGVTPLPVLPLDEGRHRVVLENPDISKRLEREVQVEAGQTAEIRVDLLQAGQAM